ncbi:MAG: HPr family phosphocarrier protein [Bacillota bacterium]|nr:HPr family phosphocarrier protein [Bacillota bacterium]
MYSKTVVINNPSGLHARPASEFINCAKKFSSRITICQLGRESEPVNAKSIVALLTLSLTQDKKAVISAKGSDEKEAVETLIALIESGFGE